MSQELIVLLWAALIGLFLIGCGWHNYRSGYRRTTRSTNSALDEGIVWLTKWRETLNRDALPNRRS